MTSRDKPQLARKCYTINSDDDDSTSSLEILSPAKKAVADGPSFTSTICGTTGFSSDDDSSEDEILCRHTGPTFARSTNTTLSRNLTPSSNPTTTKTSGGASKVRNTPRHQLTLASRKRQRPPTARDASFLDAQADREEERARKKLDAERLKRQTKLAREIQQREKQLQKEAEKKLREYQRTEKQQAAGRFAKKEIVVLLDPSLFRSNEYGLVTVTEQHDYTVKEVASTMTYKKTVQWIRRDQLFGGAEKAWNALVEGNRAQLDHIPHLVVLMDYDDYIPLIHSQGVEHTVDDDYPKLELWLIDLKRQWQQYWKEANQEPFITLVLNQVGENLDKQWNLKQGRSSSEVSLPTNWVFRDSLQWLLVQFRVDCIQCTSADDVQEAILKFTRGVSESPYADHATELACVRKIKPGPDVADDDFSKAHDTWFRQLQMIPKISESRARSLVEHYPTLQSLWQAYRNGEEATNIRLVSGCFGSQSTQASLSTTLYKVFTSNDPKARV